MIRVFIEDCNCMMTFKMASVVGNMIILKKKYGSKDHHIYRCKEHEVAVNTLKEATKNGYLFAEYLEYSKIGDQEWKQRIS